MGFILCVVKTTDVMPLVENKNREKTGNKAKRENLCFIDLEPTGLPLNTQIWTFKRF